MEKHAQESCPRCQKVFICKVNNILECDCMKVNLTKKQIEYIADISQWEFDGACLCNTCLEELKAISDIGFQKSDS